MHPDRWTPPVWVGPPGLGGTEVVWVEPIQKKKGVRGRYEVVVKQRFGWSLLEGGDHRLDHRYEVLEAYGFVG